MALEMKYYVLKPRSKVQGDRHAAASRAALRMYAIVVEDVDPLLSERLRTWASDEEKRAQDRGLEAK